MLKIRLKRFGRKKKAMYRIIIIDGRKKRDGRALEEAGFYDPIRKTKKLNLFTIQRRIQEGAKLSRTVQYLLYGTNEQLDLYTKKIHKK